MPETCSAFITDNWVKMTANYWLTGTTQNTMITVIIAPGVSAVQYKTSCLCILIPVLS